jgi:hypothetical protein
VEDAEVGAEGMIARVTMDASDGPLGTFLAELEAVACDGRGGNAGAEDGLAPSEDPSLLARSTVGLPLADADWGLNVGDSRLRLGGR